MDQDTGTATTNPEQPPPASALMSQETAQWYEQYTSGQLRAVPSTDGFWYLTFAPAREPDIKTRVESP